MQAQALAGHPVPENYFAQLSAINVNGHVEKKGGFSYLSWPYAVAQLRLAEGRYGECLCCGEAIEAARLAALPVAEYCLRCAEDREGHSNQAARLK